MNSPSIAQPISPIVDRPAVANRSIYRPVPLALAAVVILVGSLVSTSVLLSGFLHAASGDEALESLRSFLGYRTEAPLLWTFVFAVCSLVLASVSVSLLFSRSQFHSLDRISFSASAAALLITSIAIYQVCSVGAWKVIDRGIAQREDTRPNVERTLKYWKSLSGYVSQVSYDAEDVFEDGDYNSYDVRRTAESIRELSVAHVDPRLTTIGRDLPELLLQLSDIMDRSESIWVNRPDSARDEDRESYVAERLRSSASAFNERCEALDRRLTDIRGQLGWGYGLDLEQVERISIRFPEE